MLIDMRTYTYHPAQFQTFLKLYAALGFPLTTKHLGTTLAILTPTSGTANRTFQFFAYEDHDHRDRCRAGLLSDPAWLDFVRIAGPMIRVQENTILAPTPRSPVTELGAVARIGEAAADGGSGRTRTFEWLEYRCRPAHFPEALDVIDGGLSEAVERHGGQSAARFAAETGELDRVFVLTPYASLAELSRIRQAVRADTECQRLMQELGPMLVRRDVALLAPTAYSPLR